MERTEAVFMTEDQREEALLLADWRHRTEHMPERIENWKILCRAVENRDYDCVSRLLMLVSCPYADPENYLGRGLFNVWNIEDERMLDLFISRKIQLTYRTFRDIRDNLNVNVGWMGTAIRDKFVNYCIPMFTMYQ